MEVDGRVVDQRTSDGVSVAGCTKDTEQTDTTTEEVCIQGGKGQDRFEVEIVYEGEDEEVALRNRYKSCPKSARHNEFIPVSDFCLEDLPVEYRSERVLALVKAQVKLTVFLRVNATSDKRIEYFPGTHKNATRRGSGCVEKVWEHADERYRDGKCPCEECRTSGKPRQNYAEIDVRTAAHVVFDLTEGKNTVCYFDFDSDSSRLGSCPTLREAVYVRVEAEDDISNIRFVTHHLEFARQLKEAVDTYQRLDGEMLHEHGVEFRNDVNKEKLLDNMFIFNRKCQKLMEKCSGWIDRYRNMTVAEAERMLKEYKLKHNIQPGDELSDYEETLEDRICDGDEWGWWLRDVDVEYKKCCQCVIDVCYLEETYQYCVEQFGVEWVKNKFWEYYSTLKEKIRFLTRCMDDELADYADLFFYRSDHPLTIIVSHPHGFRKQISVGKVTNRNPDRLVYRRASYTYTATTCSGSSGAPVFILGRMRTSLYDKTCPHSEACDTIYTNKSAVFIG